MLFLNIQTVENLIFYNKVTRQLLPDLTKFFKEWEYHSIHGFRNEAKKTVFDFFNALEEKHIKLLEKHFGEEVKIDKVDYKLLKYSKLTLSEAECILCGFKGYDNFTISRDGDHLYICFWR